MGRGRIFAVLCGLSILLSGCEQTPEDVIVREKGAQSVKNYQSGTGADGRLAKRLGVPKHYTDRAVYENGRLIVDTDADVFVPDVDTVHTYIVTSKEGTQQMVDHVTKVFFPGAKFYDNQESWNYTKEYYQEKITELKKYKAEGNLDPYHYGKDKDGAYRFHIDRQIIQYEENLKQAPGEIELKEVTPILPSGNSFNEGFFSANAITESGTYRYQIVYDPDVMAGIDFRIEKVRDDFFAYWDTGEYLMDVEDSYDPSDPSARKRKWKEEELLNFIPVAFEEAKETAEKKAKKLGMDLSLYGWDYNVCYWNEDAIMTEQNVVDGGYIFYFTRTIDGVPVTYTDTEGGGIEGDIETDTTIPWRYEWCTITVGGDGSICDVRISNPYEIGEIQTENVKLMDFDEIIKIYGQMTEISWADLAEWETLRTWHITKITFGYARIYDPKADNKSGILVPAWDFFGEFDTESEGEEPQYNSGEHSTRSVITINAVDGTLIDRELGY